MADNSYRLVLSASINPDEITSQLNSIASAYIFKMKVMLDDSEVKASLGQIQGALSQLSGGAANKTTVQIDTAEATAQLEALRSQIEKTLQTPVTSNIKFDIADGIEKASTATLTYKNQMGEVINETYKWNTADNEWGKSRLTQLNDAIKLTQQLSAENEAMNKKIAGYRQQAEEFLKKASNMSPNNSAVKGGTEQANLINKILNENTSNGTVSIPKQTMDQLDQASAKLRSFSGEVGALGKSTLGWTNEMKIAIQRTIEWSASIGLVYGAMNQLKQGIQYVKDLNLQLTQIQEVTGTSSENINSLAKSYNGLAQQLGSTTKEVTASALQWFKQGKTIQETNDLISSTMMMSKLANMDSATATDKMTSILNGFNMTAQQSTSIVDKLTAVDNASATSVEELANALQRSSNSAQIAGVTFDQLVSYIGTVSSVSRKSADSIGESFKTIFARYQDIQKSADETGMNINNVQDAMHKANIEIMATPTTFRPFSDVLTELAGKWSTLDQVTQNYIVKALAGVRQRENLLVLLNNYNDALRMQSTEANSAGMAMQRYGIYLDSIDAKANKLTSTWEQMWSKSINSNSIKFVIDLSTAFLQLVNTIGGIIPVLTTLISLIAIFNAEGIASVVSTASGAFVRWASAMKMVIVALVTTGETALTTGEMISTGLGLIGLIVSGIVIAYNAWAGATDRALQKAAELKQEVDGLTSSLKSMRDQQVSLQDLGTQFDQLKNRTNLSVEEQKKFTDIQNQIKDLLPQVNGYYNDQGNYIISLTTNVDKLVKAKQDEIDAERKLLDIKAKDEIQAQTAAYKSQIDQINLLKKAIDDQQAHQAVLLGDKLMSLMQGNLTFDPKGATDELEKRTAEATQSLAQLKVMYANMDDETRKSVESMLKSIGPEGEAIVKEFQNIAKGVQDTGKVVQDSQGMFEALSETIKNLQNNSKDLYDVINKSMQGTLNFDDISKLAAAYADYGDALYVESGQIKVNTDVLREHTIKQANDALVTAQAQLAKDKNNASLQKEVEILTSYVAQAKVAVPLSADFVKHFEEMLNVSQKDMGAAAATSQFKGLAEQLSNVSEQYRAGEITAKNYFDQINAGIKGLDISKMFGANTDAAQLFFAGLASNATQALGQITSQFDAGQISITDFEGSLTSLSETFVNLGTMAENFASTLGLSSSETDALKSSISGISDGIAQLTQRRELDTAVQQMMREIEHNNLQAGTQDYADWAERVAEAYAKSGATFTDYQGNVYKGQEAIKNYLMGGTSNFMTFAKSTAQSAQSVITQIVHNIGALMVNLGNSIAKMHGVINFSVKPKQNVSMDGSILGKIKNLFQIPTFDISIDGSGIGQTIASAGQSLEKWTPPAVDEGLFKIGDTLNQVTPVFDKASNAASNLDKSLKGLGNSAGGANDKLKKQQEALKALLDMTIAMIKQQKEAEKQQLTDQLAGYKKIIDAKKALIDLSLKEQDYQAQEADKQANLAKLQNQMLELQLDNSEEAKAKRMTLAEDIAKATTDIQKDQRTKAADDAKTALDTEYNNYKEDIDRRTKAIDDYLKQSGRMAQDAMALINAKSADFYAQLMAYNRTYGDGIDSTVTKAWDGAYSVLDKFKGALGQIDFAGAYSKVQDLVNAAASASNAIAGAINQANNAAAAVQNVQNLANQSSSQMHGGIGRVESQLGEDLNGNGVVGYDTGGVVDAGIPTDSTHVLAQLMNGELTTTPEQASNFLSNILPNLLKTPQASLGSGMKMDKMFEINIQGNLDQNVMPKLEEVMNRMFEKLNKSTLGRGNVRNASSFSI